jgi:CMP-N-acetylneuraminic acid synthetase/regulator of RNase E activity RraA
MKIVAFVPAKGNSDRIPNKNLTVVDGEYLFKRKLRQLLECSLIDEVFLDTESDELAALAADLPVKRLKRPPELAGNTTDGHELFAWECDQVSSDIYIQALCTAPFVDADSIGRSIQALIDSPSNDSLVAVTYAKQYTWNNNEPQYGRGRIPNSIDLPRLTVEAMSLYVVRKSVVESRKRFGVNPILFELNPIEMVDVNYPDDLLLAETIASGFRSAENLALSAMSPYLSSAMLSDITREMGYEFVLPKEISGEGRFFGRAKTLLIDRPVLDEHWEKIYDGLDSYQFVRPGDVIVVKNNIPDHAYFGNLNGLLALRAGAVGAVIDGVTRDKADVFKLGFPVYSRGHYCVDIKFKGVVRSMNMPVKIGGVSIQNGDFVFSDSDGVVVIPRLLWPVVRGKVVEGIEREWNVGMAVALGKNPREIFYELGAF